MLLSQCKCSTYFIKNGANPNFFIDGRWSPIEATIVNGPPDEKSFEIIKLLIEYDCDINKHASNESIILQISRLIGAGNDSPIVRDIFYYLLDSDCDNKYLGNASIFHNVLLSGDCQMAKDMVANYGFDVNIVDHNGKTPLMIVCQISKNDSMIEIIELLLNSGADPKLLDKNKNNALFYAKSNQNTNIITILTNALGN